MVFTDPPFDLQIQSVVDRANPAEFATTSGETSDPAFRAFLKSTLGLAASVSRPGALSFVGVDWRRVADLIEVGREVFDWMLDLVVWTKPSPGQGSFYRSQHHLIGVFRVGDAQLNPTPLGRPGRSRSNVWRYAGSNVLVADAVRDCTRRGDLVFDPVSGSGTTILAAERVGRRAFAIELEPRLVDVGIRRWQQFSKRDAIHTESGQTFDERSEQAVGGQP
jgi:hypothetical protein